MFLNAIAWLIGTFVLGMLLNYIFYKFAGFLFRPIGSFCMGLAFGPLSILAGLSPQAQAKGESAFLVLGGILGSLAYAWIFGAF